MRFKIICLVCFDTIVQYVKLKPKLSSWMASNKFYKAQIKSRVKSQTLTKIWSQKSSQESWKLWFEVTRIDLWFKNEMICDMSVYKNDLPVPFLNWCVSRQGCYAYGKSLKRLVWANSLIANNITNSIVRKICKYCIHL